MHIPQPFFVKEIALLPIVSKMRSPPLKIPPDVHPFIKAMLQDLLLNLLQNQQF